jgi:hypothetical protein
LIGSAGGGLGRGPVHGVLDKLPVPLQIAVALDRIIIARYQHGHYGTQNILVPVVGVPAPANRQVNRVVLLPVLAGVEKEYLFKGDIVYQVPVLHAVGQGLILGPGKAVRNLNPGKIGAGKYHQGKIDRRLPLPFLTFPLLVLPPAPLPLQNRQRPGQVGPDKLHGLFHRAHLVIQNLGITVHPVKTGNRFVLFLGKKTQNILNGLDGGIHILFVVGPDLFSDIADKLPDPFQGPPGQTAISHSEQPGEQRAPAAVCVEQGHAERIIRITGLDTVLIYVKGGPALTGGPQIAVTLNIGITPGMEIRILQPEQFVLNVLKIHQIIIESWAPLCNEDCLL